MKRIFAVVVLTTVASSIVLGRMADKQDKAKSRTAGTEQALVQMERDWTAAALNQDAGALDKILADDWVGQNIAGMVTKTEALTELKSGDNKLASETLGDMKVRVFGDTAVVTGSDDEKSSYKGKDTSGHYTWTDVFVRRHGRWQAAASQGTLITQQ
jgi:ketosteroid isomerase-like protein